MKLKLFLIVAFLFSIAFCQAQTKEDFLSVEKSTDSLYKLYKTTTNTKEKDKLGKTLCNFLINYLSTSISYEEQIELAIKYKNDTTLETVYGKKGFYATNTSDYNTALSFLFKSLKLAEKINDTINASFLYKEIAINYIYLKNYNQSIVYLKKAINEINLFSDSITFNPKIYYYISLSRVFTEMQLPDSALNYIHIAAQLYTKYYNDSLIKDDRHELELRLNQIYSSIYLQKKDTALAEVYFKKCFAVSPESISENTDSYLQACINYSNYKKSKIIMQQLLFMPK